MRNWVAKFLKVLYLGLIVFTLKTIYAADPGLARQYLQDSKVVIFPVIVSFGLFFIYCRWVFPRIDSFLSKRLKGNVKRFWLWLKRRWDLYVAVVVITAGTCLYFLIAVGQYYRYESNAWDLGIYGQVEYHLSRGEAPAVSFKAPFRQGGDDISQGATRNFILQDHFEPILLALAPLYRLWFSPALLLTVQLIMVCFVGALGIFLLAKKVLQDGLAAILVVVGFYFLTGIQTALNSDFHANTLSVGLFPWIILLLEKSKLKSAGLLAFTVLLFNEVASIFVFAIGFYALLRKKYLWGVAVMVLSLVWFFAATKWVIPTFGGRPYAYSSEYPLGDTLKYNLRIDHLVETLTFPAVKTATIEQHIFSTAFLIPFSPGIFLLAPSFMRAFLHPSYFVAWGISRHYWIESFVFAAIAVVYGIKPLARKSRYAALFFSLLFASLSVTHGLSRSTAWFGTRPILYYFEYLERLRLSMPNYVLNSLIKNYIPKDAKVAAQNTIVPHLANRETVYLLPQVFDAEYVVFSTKDVNFAPLDENSRDSMIERFEKSPDWLDLFDFEGIRLFKRKDIKI